LLATFIRESVMKILRELRKIIFFKFPYRKAKFSRFVTINYIPMSRVAGNELVYKRARFGIRESKFLVNLSAPQHTNGIPFCHHKLLRGPMQQVWI